ncbi:N-lysine methyltransferase METTL21A-like [Olea europaea subsp. europaea]|uniref:N-lysine methyltransferase METTL21A-like n=1 Tax=Olea europaea subsp. europaea TaxID=158383 RepID=A0A8S0RMH6_OLEEU|nr:N-lysine methyltransferase METTL21A-like [Olea europaea subsp. europaea]
MFQPLVLRDVPSEIQEDCTESQQSPFNRLHHSNQAIPLRRPLVPALACRHHSSHPPRLPPRATQRRPIRILELGSGTGVVGIAAAAILGGSVTVTDLPHVLPNIQFNVKANAETLNLHGGAVEVAALSWGDTHNMEAIGREFDLIIGSDLVYHDHLYEPLLETLTFFLLESEKRIVFLMAHEKRWKKESAFFKKAKKFFDVEIIHKDEPSNGSRVGVVVYRFVGKLNPKSADP